MRKQKTLVLLLIFAMALSLLPQSAFAAKKKVKLNKKTVTVNVGKTVKIKLQNNKKKVKWTVASGKKNVTLSKKKKTEVTIKGKKAGKAKVQAKVGKKKYVCKVTVKVKKRANSSAKKTQTNTSNTSAQKGQYKLSGYIKTKNGNIVKGPFRFSVRKKDSPGFLYNASVDAKTGKYTAYLYPGTYEFFSFGYDGIENANTTAIDNAMKGQVTVGKANKEFDFVFDGNVAQGKMTRGNNIPFTGIFEIEALRIDTFYESLVPYSDERFVVDKDGNYCVLIPSSNNFIASGHSYIVRNAGSSEKIWTLNFNKGDLMNHNLTCNLQKISGEITNFGGKFDREVDLSNTLLNVTENEDGFGNGYQPKYQKITYDETTKTHSYVFLVEPGVYKMQGECAYSQKFTVPSKDVSNLPINFEAYRLCINLTNTSGIKYCVNYNTIHVGYSMRSGYSIWSGEEMIEEEDYDRDSNIDTGKHRMDEYMSAGEYSLSFHKAKLNDDGSAVLDEDGNYEEGSETTIAEFNVPEMQGEISLNY